MPRVGFEPTITASERAKTVHALDRSAAVTGWFTLAPANNAGTLPRFGHDRFLSDHLKFILNGALQTLIQQS
jgi:hypothetical protein